MQLFCYQESQVKCIQVVCKAMRTDDNSAEESFDLLQRYLNDFMYNKFLLSSQDLSIQILQEYFGPLRKEKDMLKRLIALHAHAHVHKLSLAQATALLRTVKRIENVLPSSTLLSSSLFAAQPAEISGHVLQNRREDLAIYMICKFFTTLRTLLQSHLDMQKLMCWYKVCQDLVCVFIMCVLLYESCIHLPL